MLEVVIRHLGRGRRGAKNVPPFVEQVASELNQRKHDQSGKYYSFEHKGEAFHRL